MLSEAEIVSCADNAMLLTGQSIRSGSCTPVSMLNCCVTMPMLIGLASSLCCDYAVLKQASRVHYLDVDAR